MSDTSVHTIGYTKFEAEKFLNSGTIVFDDFEENFDKYAEEWRSFFGDNVDLEYLEFIQGL